MGLTKTITLLLVVTLLSVTLALAEPIGVESAETINSSRFNDTIAPAQIDAQAGNLTQLELNSTGVTRTWQGFYGNITGSLILADSSGNNFYDWNVSTPSGQVYASRNDSVSWTGVGCMQEVTMDTEETYLGKDPSDPDSINKTYTMTSHPSFHIGTDEQLNCPSTQAYGSGETQNSEYWQVLLEDSGANPIYTAVIEDTEALGFNDQPWDFQLLVGENGQPGNEASTPYFFYVELN